MIEGFLFSGMTHGGNLNYDSPDCLTHDIPDSRIILILLILSIP